MYSSVCGMYVFTNPTYLLLITQTVNQACYDCIFMLVFSFTTIFEMACFVYHLKYIWTQIIADKCVAYYVALLSSICLPIYCLYVLIHIWSCGSWSQYHQIR